ncbi:MAG: hypothetical protein ABFD89_02025 [Bryobacteraceae bacterium]
MTAESIAHGLGLRRAGKGFRGACPIHGGSSFTLAEKGGNPVFYCWSGCERGTILAELKRRGLWPESNWTPAQKRDWAAHQRRDEADLDDAHSFADVAHIFCEEVLEKLTPADPERSTYTRLLAVLRTDAGLLAEYRAWRSTNPKLTRALVQAGARHVQRLRGVLEYHLLGEGGDSRAS